MLAVVGSIPRFGSLSIFINLWCSFCLTLYIHLLCRGGWAFIFCPPSEQLTTELLKTKLIKITTNILRVPIPHGALQTKHPSWNWHKTCFDTRSNRTLCWQVFGQLQLVKTVADRTQPVLGTSLIQLLPVWASTKTLLLVIFTRGDSYRNEVSN